MTSFQVSMCVCICVRYGVSVEVRGQLAGVRSLLAPCGSWGLNSDSQAPFFPLSHLTAPRMAGCLLNELKTHPPLIRKQPSLTQLFSGSTLLPPAHRLSQMHAGPGEILIAPHPTDSSEHPIPAICLEAKVFLFFTVISSFSSVELVPHIPPGSCL